MRFTHVLHALHCEPWLITEQYHAALVDIVERHIAGQPNAGFLEAFTAPQATMTIEDGVADIPIDGVIGKRLSAMEKSCGACDVADIGANLQAALSNDKVSHIILSIDSPGGGVSGVPELGAMIAAACDEKPVLAYVDGMMASAAYWLGCGASAIYGSESSTVGSIGVYMAVMDSSRRAEMAGLKVDVIKAGTFKGAGVPGTTLSEAQRADLQGQVDQIKGMFDTHVASYRPRMDMKKSAQGQIFIGKEAVSAGLIDSIASKSRALADLRSM